MEFMHSLVKGRNKSKKAGWVAPSELGEATPQYISFVLPVDADRAYFPRYTCETSGAAPDGDRVIATHEMVRRGRKSFLLRVGNHELWFVVKTNRKGLLPYVGKLQHEDFRSLLSEIEAVEPDKLDRLFDVEGICIIGCEPFTHYSGIKRLAASA